MARTKSALPWGMALLFAVLFVAAWWIEDCVLYAIPWEQTRVVGVASFAATQLKLATVGSLLWASLTLARDGLSLGATYLAALIGGAFGRLPASWRATGPMRALSWSAASITANFGFASAAEFGQGLLWTVEKVIKAFIAINGAAWLYNIGRRLLRAAAVPVGYLTRLYGETPEEAAQAAAPGLPSYIRPVANGKPRPRRVEYIQFFDHVQRIGIILPGGGARAVYQAGALKAIYEFLKDYEALDKVKMIAASATGAWNAMFWLADMIEPDHYGHPNIERWWKSLSLRRIAEFPWFFLPFRGNSLLTAAPWRENFHRIFRNRLDALLASGTAPHFYLTRSDIDDGVLRYATNWPGLG
ncbi:MAG: patatin-like phospholipase family protein, partial [Candidatus Binataceae bacterium]